MTKYSEIIRRIMDNANIVSDTSNDRLSIKRDIEDTLNDMFTATEAPIKTTYKNTTLNTPIDVSGKITADGTYTYPNNINSLTDLVVTLSNEVLSVGTTNVKVKIVSSFGDIILEEDIVLTDEVEYSEALDVLVSDIVGATLTIETSNSISDVTYSLTWNELVGKVSFDSDVFIPLEVEFTSSINQNGANYRSAEMTEEEFARWNPNGGILDSEITDLTELKADIDYSTIENLEYDYNIGYFFRMAENNIELHYKPATKGVIVLRHSFFPTVDVSEANTIPLHKAFANCLVYGATLKQLEKKLLKAGDELEMVKIKSSIGIYTPKYTYALSHYSGFNRKKTEVTLIKMFGIVDDVSMELN